MAYVSLTERDINVLEKIRDPEYDPSLAVRVDPALPKDPHITDTEIHQFLSRQERDIILCLQGLELQSARSLSNRTALNVGFIDEYRNSIAKFDQLIENHPQYASARNNRAQALRRLYGDALLISDAPKSPLALFQDIDDTDRVIAGKIVLGDLDRAISLLTPTAPYSRLSPQVAKTLSMAHTQRAAIYLMTSKLMSGRSVSVDAERPEAAWSKLDFEEHASRDFAMGGRYGNEIAKGLAVSTNPTAKLCGQMVREAMKKEYGSDSAS